MRGTKFFGLALLVVVFAGTAGLAQNPPPLNALVWTTDSSGKSAPFVVTHPITGAKYISAFGKLDTTIVKQPQSIMWSTPRAGAL